MKLAVIGGGSSYTPELIDGLFARLDKIPVSEVWMMDVNQDRLDITAGLSKRMAEKNGNPFTVHATQDLREAVKDAKYVVTQLRVGGIQARIEDEKLGLRYDIVGQETTGVGGFAKALRTIPVILDVAHAMEELAPGGILVNFTNPSGIVTESLIRHSNVTSVGLCNIPICMIMEIVEHLKVPMESVGLDYVGLNHLAWVRGATAEGKDIWDAVLQYFMDNAENEWEMPGVAENMREVMKSLKMGLNPYLQYFYCTDTVMETLRTKPKTRGEEVVEIEKSLLEKYRQPDLKEKPPELSKRGGAHYSTAAFYLIESMEQNARNHQIVCCRNNGAVPTFDDDAAVELTAVIGENGAEAIPQGAPHPAIRGLMQQVKAYETLTVEAAVTGDREAAFQAMLENPLMPDAVQSRKLLDELLEINKRFVNKSFHKA